jgi:hypothetical protein
LLKVLIAPGETIIVATVVWETGAVRQWYPSITTAGLKQALHHPGR